MVSRQDDEFDNELHSEILSYSENEAALARLNFDIIKELIISDDDETFKRPHVPQDNMMYRARAFDPRRAVIEEDSGEDYENEE